MSGFNTTSPYLFQLACHEAGHAVALFAAAHEFNLPGRDIVMGMKLDKAGDGFLIDFNGRYTPNCRGLLNASQFWLDELKLRSEADASLDKKVLLARKCEAHILCLLAGPYAEAIQEGLPCGSLDLSNKTNLDDFYQADMTRKLISSLHLPHSAFHRRAFFVELTEAKSLVMQHWFAIQQIATKLHEEGELTGAEAFNIFTLSQISSLEAAA